VAYFTNNTQSQPLIYIGLCLSVTASVVTAIEENLTAS